MSLIGCLKYRTNILKNKYRLKIQKCNYNMFRATDILNLEYLVTLNKLTVSMIF